MKYIRVASKLARVVKEINLAILTLKIDNKCVFNFNNIPTRSNPVKIHLNLPAFCSAIFKTTILISDIYAKVGRYFIYDYYYVPKHTYYYYIYQYT